MHNRLSILPALAGVLLLIPSIAYANAGTPLMWAGMAHLAIGNWFIGIGEGWLISRLFKVPKRSAISTMIGANYVSAIVGYFVVAGLNANRNGSICPAITIYNCAWLLVGMLIALFALTVLLEWPFCYRLLKQRENAARVSFRASVIVQAASYAVLIPWYMLSSPISVITQVRATHDLSFASSCPAVVYYISSDGELCSVRPDGTERTTLGGGRFGSDRALCVMPSKSPGYWDLAVTDSSRSEDTAAPISERIGRVVPQKKTPTERKVLPGFLRVLDLRLPDHRNWEVSQSFWAAGGISAHNEKMRGELHIALETPMAAWYPRSVTVLPDDLVVYQLGNQVVIVDINRRKIGLLAMGHGPVAVLEDGR